MGVAQTLDEVTGTQLGDTVNYVQVSGSCTLNGRDATFADAGPCVVKATVERTGYSAWDSGDRTIAVEDPFKGFSWLPAIKGRVGTPLVLDAVKGIRKGDVVTYTNVSGSCRFGAGSEQERRTLTAVESGTCLLKATVARPGFPIWDSGSRLVYIVRGIARDIVWTPVKYGRVGIPLLLDIVQGTQNGDKVFYKRVRGNCRLAHDGDKAQRLKVILGGGESCVIVAIVEREGYNIWDSGERSINAMLSSF